MSVSKGDNTYYSYLKILSEELVPAMGCTEPIAIAYCVAVARDYLGCIPDSITVEASGNIIKNVKSVIVPNTNMLRGIEAAAAAGIIAGDASKKLEVISDVSIEKQKIIEQYLKEHTITVSLAESPNVFDIVATLYKGTSYSKVRIANYHTNIVWIEQSKT